MRLLYMAPHYSTQHLHDQAANLPDFRTMKLNAFHSSIPCPLNYLAFLKVLLRGPSEKKKQNTVMASHTIGNRHF